VRLALLAKRVDSTAVSSSCSATIPILLLLLLLFPSSNNNISTPHFNMHVRIIIILYYTYPFINTGQVDVHNIINIMYHRLLGYRLGFVYRAASARVRLDFNYILLTLYLTGSICVHHTRNVCNHDTSCITVV